MDFEKIKQAAQNYLPDMTKFLRDLIAIPSESCEEEGVVRRTIAEMERLENRLLPEDIDYAAIQGLRLEAREKLARLRPRSLGQAGRVSGVSPADIAVLMVYLGK